MISVSKIKVGDLLAVRFLDFTRIGKVRKIVRGAPYGAFLLVEWAGGVVETIWPENVIEILPAPGLPTRAPAGKQAGTVKPQT